MLWIAFILFGLAIVLWRYGEQQTDDIIRVLSFLLALVCLIPGLVAVPGLIKPAFIASLLMYPTYTSSASRNNASKRHGHKPNCSRCPRFCVLRSRCRHLT